MYSLFASLNNIQLLNINISINIDINITLIVDYYATLSIESAHKSTIDHEAEYCAVHQTLRLLKNKNKPQYCIAIRLKFLNDQ